MISPFAAPDDTTEQTAFLTTGPFKGNLLVADYGNNRIIRRAPPFDSPQPAIPFITGLNRPHGLAVDSAGNLFVSEDPPGYGGFIKKFAPDGTFMSNVREIGRARKIIFDSSDNLYIAAWVAGAVIKIAPDGTQTTIGNVADPNGLAVYEPPPTTIFLVHGIAQDGREDGDLQNFARNLRRLLDSSRFIVNAEFDFRYCGNNRDCHSDCTIGGTRITSIYNGARALVLLC